MKNIKAMLLFMLKSLVFSAIFVCTAFIIYAVSSFNSPRKNVPDQSTSINIEEYNRQIELSAKAMERQKELIKRAEANMTEQEKNTKRLAAILDIWEQQTKKGK